MNSNQPRNIDDTRIHSAHRSQCVVAARAAYYATRPRVFKNHKRMLTLQTTHLAHCHKRFSCCTGSHGPTASSTGSRRRSSHSNCHAVRSIAAICHRLAELLQLGHQFFGTNGPKISIKILLNIFPTRLYHEFKSNSVH